VGCLGRVSVLPWYRIGYRPFGSMSTVKSSGRVERFELSGRFREVPRTIFGGGSCPQYGADRADMVGVAESSNCCSGPALSDSSLADVADESDAQAEELSFISNGRRSASEKKQQMSCSSSSM
jgi:hypothetical protein